MGSITCHIMSLIINSFKGEQTHTHINMHTDFLDESNFKKQCAHQQFKRNVATCLKQPWAPDLHYFQTFIYTSYRILVVVIIIIRIQPHHCAKIRHKLKFTSIYCLILAYSYTQYVAMQLYSLYPLANINWFAFHSAFC